MPLTCDGDVLCWTSATNTTDITELQINNDESTHRPFGIMRIMITSVQSTFEVFGSIYWGPYFVLSEPCKLAVKKLLSPSVGKVP
jgi:hypothetical protein